jgi:hypothetical protein
LATVFQVTFDSAPVLAVDDQVFEAVASIDLICSMA